MVVCINVDHFSTTDDYGDDYDMTIDVKREKKEKEKFAYFLYESGTPDYGH